MAFESSHERAPTWGVGELSQATGLSVRVLRHWEDRGLVTAHRSSHGHRRYDPQQVTRLFRAIALRRTGLSLAQVAALLSDQDPDPAATLRGQLRELDDDLRRRGKLRRRLAGALHSLQARAPGDPDHDPATLMKVIETMTMFEQYVHGYRADETDRLNDQAQTLVDLVHDGTVLAPGSDVLEVGCGVGAQSVVLLERHPGITLTCMDTSQVSLDEARRRVSAQSPTAADGVRFVHADVFDVPRPDGVLDAGRFDHAFVCFVLEHLADPVGALARVRELLRPGGTITVVEGDHGSTYFHPDSEAARDAIACQVTLQRHAGGDALIGRRLFPLLSAAGFADPAVSPRQVYVDASRPALQDGFIRKTFTSMIEGIREPAIAAGLIDADRFDAGIDDLLRTTQEDGVFCYSFFKATAHVPPV